MKRWLPLLLVVIGVVAVALLAVARRSAGSKAEPHGDEHAEHADENPFLELSAEAAAALELQTETVRPSSLSISLEATGRLIADESRVAHLGSRLAGRLASVAVRVGERVAAGQVVATLDSVDAAQAAAAYREAASRLDAAQRNLATRRQLAASGSFTVGPLEEARRQLADARVELARVETELAQARNEAEAARAELARTERLVAGGSYTTAAEEAARQALAEAERGLAEARGAVAEADAEVAATGGEVQVAEARVASAESLAERTAALAATGELDRAPLEQAQNALAAARSRREQAEAALEQAQRQLQRGEELYRAELIALNDLENRRAAVRERAAQRAEAVTAAANAESALRRQEQISAAQMAGGRAEQEAQNALAEARRELLAAEARRAKALTRVAVVEGGVVPAEAAVVAARSAFEREQRLAGDQTRGQSVLDDARLRVAQADRTVQGRQSEGAEAAHKVRVAQAALEREQRLAAGQVRAREQLLEAEREVRSARIAHDNAAEVLHLLGASLSGREGPVQIPIRAPLSGLVTALDAAVGEAVGAEHELMTIVDLSEVYVEADVYEKDLPQVREGQLVEVSVRAFPDERFTGPVISIGGELDPETRAAHVRARLANPDWRLRPGMFAEVAFVVSRAAGVLTVAAEALQEIEGERVVFVQRTPEQYELRPVTTGRDAGGRVEIPAGLRPGEVVVTRGSYLLKSQRLRGELGEGHAH